MPSKISVHLNSYPNRVFDILQRMQPGILKVFNQSSEMNVDEIRRRCPNVVIVYRHYSNLDYHTPADAFFAEIGDTLNKLRGRDVLWEGINEPVVKSIDDAKALNAWYVRFAQLMHAQGELVAGFSWSTGNPLPDKLSTFTPFLVDAAAAVNVHAFHEYYTTAAGQKDWGGYRAFEQALPASARKPVVITETGLDDNGDPNTGGWRGKKSPQEYLDLLKQYDTVLQQDPYVLGAAVFQWGDGGWPSFELGSMMDLISTYVASVGGGVATPKPWPVPQFGSVAPSFSFSISPTAITSGESATLKWDVDGASKVLLGGAPVDPHATQVVTPTEDTTYMLHVILPDGSEKDLTATIAVRSKPLVKNAAFAANPATIATGASATLTWNTQGASAVALNGTSVAANGSQVVSPLQTMTYTLHIVFVDGTTRDLAATVSISAQPPTTRPPTVVITPDNIVRLKTYPRPALDNGRGLHFNIDLRDETNARTVAHLQSINCRWTLIYAQDENQAGRAAKPAWNVGIMPVVRIGKKVDEPFDPVRYVDALKSIGAPPYVQIYNEPGDNREWKQWPGDNWAGIFGARWAQMAITVYDAGGYPGLQILGKDEFDAAVDSVRAQNRTDIWSRAFFVLHNYGANHPPAYPYDPRNQIDHPGATILDDDTAVLVFLEYAKWMQDRIGFVLPIIGGEGGWEFGAAEDNRYPKVEQPYHAQYHEELFDWFRTGKLANGEPLPDYLFGVTPWIEGGWGADDWWGGPLGDKMQTIVAVQSIPSFVRKFSWDDGVAPPTPTYSFSVSPTSVPAGESATLKWDIDGASSVALDGQPVAAHGTQPVTPTQTSIYVLHIVFTDGTTKDMNAIVTVTAPPTTPGLQWDSRLDALGVKLERNNSAHAWRLISAQYQDETQSGGNHHIYFKAVRADGSPASGLKFVIDWVGRATRDDPAVVTTDANGDTNCPLWAILHPEKQDGPYFTSTREEPGDKVSGMGLPVNRHVNFLLTYKYG